MGKRPPHHTVIETRDWAKIVLAVSIAIAIVVMAGRGDLSAAVVAAAASLLRQPPDIAVDNAPACASPAPTFC